MKLIIHDLQKEEFEKLNIDVTDCVVIDKNDNIKKCVGCFNCWTKTPGTCVIKDGFENNSHYFKEAEKVIVISKNCYGMYSPFVKNVFDRSLSYVMPYFRIVYNEMHHAKRYDKKLNIDYIFYGNSTEQERNTLHELVKANQENFDSEYNLKIIENIGDFVYE